MHLIINKTNLSEKMIYCSLTGQSTVHFAIEFLRAFVVTGLQNTYKNMNQPDLKTNHILKGRAELSRRRLTGIHF